MGKNFILSITKVITLCVIIFAVSAFFVYDTKIIGWVIFALGLLCLGTLNLFKIIIKSVWPDIIFGLIDNGFLTTLTVIGGIVGIALGWLISFVVNWTGLVTTSVSLSSVVLAFGVSAFVGIVFGYYPARRASMLNPIEALRYE